MQSSVEQPAASLNGHLTGHHKILIAAYFILKDKTENKELGAEHLQELRKEKQINQHLKLLKELGVDIELKNVA